MISGPWTMMCSSTRHSSESSQAALMNVEKLMDWSTSEAPSIDLAQQDISQLKAQLTTTKMLVYGHLPLCLILSITSIALTLIMFLPPHGFLGGSQQQPSINKQVQQHPDFCLPCERLRRNALEDFNSNELYTKVVHSSADGKNKETQCCIDQKNATQLQEFMTGFFVRNIHDEKDSGTLCPKLDIVQTSGNGTKCVIHTVPSSGGNGPAAHLLWHKTGSKKKQSTSGPEALISWIHGGDLAFLHKVDFRNGTIAIHTPGRYYIYSQVYFRENIYSPSPDSVEGQSQQNNQILSHYMYRSNLKYLPNDGKQRLLQHSQTKCWVKSKRFFEHTSFLAGVFNLRMGDEIYVCVSNSSIVHSDERSTFFGILKL